MSSVTLQKGVSFVSPSPTGLWESEGLSRSLTTVYVDKDVLDQSFNQPVRQAATMCLFLLNVTRLSEVPTTVCLEQKETFYIAKRMS